MPPKPKITREEILLSAYDLALKEGFGSLSSRNVAHAAGCSVQPVFTHFPTMESLRLETYRYACKQCANEVLNEKNGKDLLTTLTHWMLDLAKNRPNLFEILYLSDLNNPQSFSDSLMHTENHQKMIEIISHKHNISLQDSQDILMRSCFLLMGIGTMICINKVDLAEETVIDIMYRTVADLISGIPQHAI